MNCSKYGPLLVTHDSYFSDTYNTSFEVVQSLNHFSTSLWPIKCYMASAWAIDENRWYSEGDKSGVEYGGWGKSSQPSVEMAFWLPSMNVMGRCVMLQHYFSVSCSPFHSLFDQSHGTIIICWW